MDLAERVYALVMKIPEGRVTTYKILAKKVGSSPRRIGQILKKNPHKHIPCHRVVMSDGSIGGFRGRHFKEKINLLKEEGIKFGGPGGQKIRDFKKIITYLSS